MKKKTVAFILNEMCLPVPNVLGGAVETLMTMLLEQNEKCRKYDFIFVYPAEKKHKEIFNDSVCYGVPINAPSNKLSKFWWKVRVKLNQYLPDMISKSDKYYRQAYKLAKKGKADFIVAEGGMPEQYDVFMHSWPKEKMIFHIHCHMEKPKGSDAVFGKVLAISKFVAREWDQNKMLHMGNMQVLFNAVRREYFDKELKAAERSEIRSQLNIKSDDCMILYCGRIVAVKGVKELIRAVLSIPDSKIKLVLIGSSNFAKENVETYAEEVIALCKNSANKVKYIGYVPNEELYRYYKSADMQVVPSLWEEAAGLVALEGMCSKLPLIITRSGGMVEYVNDKYTCIIPKDGDVEEAIRCKILYLWENNEKRKEMAEGAYRHTADCGAEKYYCDFDEIITRWFEGNDRK